MSVFDPYHTWLGIPKSEQPPHHYRLLGIQAFETEPRVIDNAADRLMIHLRTFSAGPNGQLSQKLLNEVATARSVLQNADLRPKYDAALRARLQAAAPKPQAPKVITQYVQVPVHVPMPMQPPLPSGPPPMHHGGPRPIPVQVPAAESAAAPNLSFGTSSASASYSRRRKGSEGDAGGAIVGLLKVAIGGAGGIAIAVLGVWIAFRSDPFGLFESKQDPVAQAPKVSKLDPDRVIPPKTKTSLPVKPAKTEPGTAGATELPAEKPPESPAATVDPEPMPPDPEPRPAPVEPIAPSEPPPTPTFVRNPVPSTDQQKAKEAELKKQYEAEFKAGIKLAGREAFPDFLLDTAAKSTSDSVARFVLLREAFNRLVPLKDFGAAADIVDLIDREFEMNPFELRLELLIAASNEARQPAERKALAGCAAELVEQAIAHQRIDEAEKFVRIAEAQARASGDTELRAKMTALKIRVDKLAGDSEQGAATPAAAPLPPFSLAFSRTQAFEPVDLMSKLNAGELKSPSWSDSHNGMLISQATSPLARIPSHYAPPSEYQVVLNVRRRRFGGDSMPGAFVVGLVGPKSQFMAVIDHPTGGEFGTMLSVADTQPTNNPTFTKASFANIPDDGREAMVVCEVRRTSVTVRVNGTPVCRYEGPLDKLVLPKEWSVSNPKAPFVGSQNSSFQISSWSLLPVEPESKLNPTDAAPGFGAPPATAPDASGFFNRQE